MDNTPPTTHRISEFYRWQTEGSLKLNPPFQRNPVWSDKNRSYLIDTVLNQLPVPEIYMQVDTNENGYTKYIVVDGQQRIRAILDFIAGTFAILESESTAFGGKEIRIASIYMANITFLKLIKKYRQYNKEQVYRPSKEQRQDNQSNSD